MSSTGARLVLIAVFFPSLLCLAQSPAGLSPVNNPPVVLPLPSPPDMPLPDPTSFPKQHVDKKQSPAKQVGNRIAPVCMDVFFHSCLYWRGDNAPQPAEADREFAKNYDVGDVYFKEKNYKAAESRFRDALQYKPDEPEAVYKLAVSVEKLGNAEDAAGFYQYYLKLAPTGEYAERARKALKKTAQANPQR